MKRKIKQKMPPGWTAKRMQDVLSHYDNQSDEDAAAEIEEGFDAETETIVIVPKALLPAIKKLIQHTKKARAG